MRLLGDLTDREREILGLLAQGLRNEDIAKQLYISPQTVQTHVRNILGKLRVHSKLEAVTFAVKHGVSRSAEPYPNPGIEPRARSVEASGATHDEPVEPPPPRRPTRSEGPSEPLPRSGLHPSRGRSAEGRSAELAVGGPGELSTRASSRGALNRARSSRQCSRSSSSVGGSADRSRARPRRPPAAPHSGSGRPATATSATFACRLRTASTSSGQIVSPPLRIASSARPNDLEVAVRVERAEVVGREPPLGVERRPRSRRGSPR